MGSDSIEMLAADCGNSCDEGGHLIATQFDGPGDGINLVPQNWKLNRGADSLWRRMEKDWVKALDDGKRAEVTMKLEYLVDSQRLTRFLVTYKIDGEEFTQPFENQAGG